MDLNTRWELIQQIKNQFWSRWTRDYLHHLQQRPKWFSPQANLKVGDLVVIHEPQSPPLHWKMGRVLEVYPGPDQRIRVVNLRTRDGEMKRPATKLTLLLPGAGEC